MAADLAARLAGEAAELAVADSATAVALLRQVRSRRGLLSEEVVASAVGVASRCQSLGDGGGGAVLDALAEGGWKLPGRCACRMGFWDDGCGGGERLGF